MEKVSLFRYFPGGAVCICPAVLEWAFLFGLK
jgi:hypothetical protein